MSVRNRARILLRNRLSIAIHTPPAASPVHAQRRGHRLAKSFSFKLSEATKPSYSLSRHFRFLPLSKPHERICRHPMFLWPETASM